MGSDTEFAELRLSEGAGPLERLGSGVWLRPGEVRVEGEWLVWGAAKSHRVRPGKGMLDEFHGLADAGGKQIAAYARRWGILGLCQHGMPWNHSRQPRLGFGPPPSGKGCNPLTHPESGEPVEPIGLWRAYARHSRALLRIAVHLRERRAAPEEDWRAAYRLHEFLRVNRVTGAVEYVHHGPLLREWGSLDVDRRTFSRFIQDWLEQGRVIPFFAWSRAGPSVDVGGSSLFGALGVQLMLTASGARGGLGICAHCARPYLADRKPRSDRANYCPTCQADGASQHRSQARYRERLRA